MAMLGWKQDVSQKDINVGIELETLYESREKLCRNLANKTSIFGEAGISHNRNHGLDCWSFDHDVLGTIQIVSDSSVSGFGYDSCEVITPVLTYSQIPVFFEMIEYMKSIGVKVNSTCGMHVHTSIRNREITPSILVKLLQHTVTRQDMIWLACRGEQRWCKGIKYETGKEAKKHASSMEAIRNFWYKQESYDSYGDYDSDWNDHYNSSRYRGVNLHSFFQGKGIEFRYFQGTLDTEKIMAFIELSRGMIMDAVNSLDMRQYVYVDRPYDIKYDGSVKWSNESYLYKYAGLWEGYMDRMQISKKSQKILLEHFTLE